LRLYVGEIRDSRSRFQEPGEMQDGLLQMVEGAFKETEHVCALIKIIADSFEGPLYPETAAARGRDVIIWWARSGCANGLANGPVAPASIHALLTPREREVLGHISQGCSNKLGAIQMQIGPRTFESHRARIMRKLGARNAADLVRMALSEEAAP
jgi:DNA-binding CsgD family transcriptional regulator